MTDLSAQRRFFAEEIQIASNLRSEAIVEALAAVPRERFLPPGPWTVRSEADFGSPPRRTPGDDPRFVYHNVAVGIDPARMLFNGVPGLIAMAIDRLGVGPGDHALHIGTGTGYFTALIAHCVGPSGRVVGLEVDEALAAQARRHLSPTPWVEIRRADGTGALDGPFDAVLVNAGVTHPLDGWLDALGLGGRMILPITASAPAMGNIGKGLLVLLTRGADPASLEARAVTFVAIFSAVGVRDEAMNAEIGKELARNPFPPLRRCRRDPHERSKSCWVHGPAICFSLA